MKQEDNKQEAAKQEPKPINWLQRLVGLVIMSPVLPFIFLGAFAWEALKHFLKWTLQRLRKA